MADLIRCAQCAHWDHEQTRTAGEDPPGFNVCLLVKQKWDVTQPREVADPDVNATEIMSQYSNMLAIVDDGESYLAELITHGDFGCVMAAPRNNKQGQ